MIQNHQLNINIIMNTKVFTAHSRCSSRNSDLLHHNRPISPSAAVLMAAVLNSSSADASTRNFRLAGNSNYGSSGGRHHRRKKQRRRGASSSGGQGGNSIDILHLGQIFWLIFDPFLGIFW